MPVRSKQLAAPAFAPVAGAVIYTAPSGETSLIKTITLTNATGAAGLVALGINGLGGAAQIVRKTVLANDSILLTPFLVLQPGDTVQAAANPANTVSVSLHGAELEGVAD